MPSQLIIYRAPKFNNQIHLKLAGLKDDLFHKIKSVEYIIFIDNSPLKSINKNTANFTACSFTEIPYKENGNYHGVCKINFSDEKPQIELKSSNITITDIEFEFPDIKKTPELESSTERYFTTKDNFIKRNGFGKYLISILFRPNGYERFVNEHSLKYYESIKSNAVFQRSFTDEECKKNSIGRFAYHATIKGNLTVEEMITITEELSTLEYITYAVLTPDFEGYEPEIQVTKDENKNIEYNIVQTPDFEPQQFYLKNSEGNYVGLNVLDAWKRTTGRAATIRLLEGGLRQDHEDLEGNIIVVSNSSNWEKSNNHATACCGIMVSIKNSYGTSGIAYNASLYFYNLSSSGLEEALRDVSAGDIISVSLGAPTEIDLPLIVERNWWEFIREITNRGALFVLAAGNGGNDISEVFKNGQAEDFGECGVFLAGGCDSREGVRNPSSNYNYHSSHVNAPYSYIASTGYGSENGGYGDSHGPNSYTKNARGTSFSTPQCAGSLALIQSYGIEKYNIFFNREQMLGILQLTGDTEGLDDKIGYRPNVDKALSYIDSKVSGAL